MLRGNCQQNLIITNLLKKACLRRRAIVYMYAKFVIL